MAVPEQRSSDTGGAQPPEAPVYRISVRGRIGARLLDAFTPLTARAVNDGSVLEGPIEDQAALHGVLSRIQSLGLELMEVRRVAR